MVRPRSQGDIEVCLRLLDDVHDADGYPPISPKDPRRFLVSDRELGAWVAEVDGAVVGHVALHDGESDPSLAAAFEEAAGLPSELLAVVARLFVAQSARREGVGAALLSVATKLAHQRGRTPVLDVADTLVNARRLYEKCGWRRAKRISFQIAGHPPVGLLIYVGPTP